MVLLVAIPLGFIHAYENELFLKTYFLYPMKIEPDTQKAVYLTGYSMSSEQKRLDTYGIIKSTELNSLVFDVKDDFGNIYYNSKLEIASELGEIKGFYDIEDVLLEMDSRNIYSIARFVLFKDSVLATKRQEWALKDMRTQRPIRLEGSYWIDIYCEEAWDYYIQLMTELAQAGVDEIQFDYIRGPAKGPVEYAQYTHNGDGSEKTEAIQRFLVKSRKALSEYDVKLSADVFGWIFIVEDDQEIGQLLEDIIINLDYIYPMIYPSHYSKYFLGHNIPEAYPYEVVKYTLEKGFSRVGNQKDKIIPWLQAFSIDVNYGQYEILEEIKATEEMGIKGFLFWNAANHYNTVERALMTRHETD